MMKRIYIVILMMVLVGCAPTKYIVPNDTITKTKTKTKTIERDSIYNHEKDSMAITLRTGAQVGSDPACYPCGRTIGGQTLLSYPARVDTLVIEKWHEHYKDRWLCRIDTIINNDTTVVYTPVEVVKEIKVVPAFYKWCAGILIVIVIGIIARIVIKLL